jgi:hypothetical protein
MKTRHGFVSNSSSSSFIVIFDKEPTSKEELKNLLFPNNNMDDYLDFSDYNEEKMTIEEVVHYVFAELKEANRKSLLGVFVYHYNAGELFAKEEDKLEMKILRKKAMTSRDWSAEEKLTKKMSKDTVDEILKRHKGKFIAVCEFSDDSAKGCVLEHGNIFYNVEHYAISNH